MFDIGLRGIVGEFFNVVIKGVVQFEVWEMMLESVVYLRKSKDRLKCGELGIKLMFVWILVNSKLYVLGK